MTEVATAGGSVAVREPRRGALGPGGLAAVGAVAFVLLAANLLYATGRQGCDSAALVCSSEGRPWTDFDTGQYLGLAAQLRARGLFRTQTILRPPGYPAVLAASLALTGEATPALWLAALFGGLAAAATAWLAGRLGGGRGAALAGGALFCLWLSNYRYSAMLLTDALHAYIAVCAVVLTLRWRDRERAVGAGLAGLLWLWAQAIRPTFVALPLLLPLLLWKRRASARYAAVSVALWLATFLVPGYLIAVNHARHGVAMVSALPGYGVACEAVPRLKARLGMGEFHRLRKQCVDYYGIVPVERRTRKQLADAFAFFAQHPLPALAAQLGAVADQMLDPLRPWYHEQSAHLYPGWLRVGRPTLAVFWLAALGSLVWLVRVDPGLAAFLALTAALVMGPASNVAEVGGRYRLLLDLLWLPVVAAAGAALLARVRATA